MTIDISSAVRQVQPATADAGLPPAKSTRKPSKTTPVVVTPYQRGRNAAHWLCQFVPSTVLAAVLLAAGFAEGMLFFTVFSFAGVIAIACGALFTRIKGWRQPKKAAPQDTVLTAAE